MARAVIEPVLQHADARGVVLEPIASEAIGAQRNVHLVLTTPGAVRGNHYHERGTEVAIVIGPGRVRLREEDGVRDVDVPDGAAWRFTMPPGVSHAFEAPGPGPLVIVSFNSVAHDRIAPDVVRDVLILRD